MADIPPEMRLVILTAIVFALLISVLPAKDKPMIGRPAKRPPTIQDYRKPKKQKAQRAKWHGSKGQKPFEVRPK